MVNLKSIVNNVTIILILYIPNINYKLNLETFVAKYK
jgi:hypothetical protein